MIKRETAAKVRYARLVLKQHPGQVAQDHGLTVGQVERISSGALLPSPDARVVITPEYQPRSRKLTPEQRVHIAHLLCYGHPIQALAQEFGVAIRSIQHVKEAYTRSVDAVMPDETDDVLMNNIAAEARYRHYHLLESISMLAARYMVNYKVMWHIVRGKTFKPGHGRTLKDTALSLDAEDTPGRAVRMFVYGASLDYICQTEGEQRAVISALVDAHTEVID